MERYSFQLPGHGSFPSLGCDPAICSGLLKLPDHTSVTSCADDLPCTQFGALTFHNFAKLEHYSPPLCQAMDDLLAEGSPEWTPKLISFTLWAFAKLRHMPGPAARVLVEDWLAR